MPKMTRKERIALLWRRVFTRKPAMSWQAREYASVLENLARQPYACAALAEKLEIECDPGESAATFVAEMAQEAANDCRARQAERDAAYYRSRTA